MTTRPNAIVEENRLPGSPSTEWDINGWGDPSIQGFGHDISIDRGETIHFKIKTDASAYRIDIYRIGERDGERSGCIPFVDSDIFDSKCRCGVVIDANNTNASSNLHITTVGLHVRQIDSEGFQRLNHIIIVDVDRDLANFTGIAIEH